MVTLISFLNLSAVFVTVPEAVLVITVLLDAKVSMVGQWQKMHTSGFGCDPRSHQLPFGQSAQSSRLQTKMVIEKRTSSIMHLVLCRRWGRYSLLITAQSEWIKIRVIIYKARFVRRILVASNEIQTMRERDN